MPRRSYSTSRMAISSSAICDGPSSPIETPQCDPHRLMFVRLMAAIRTSLRDLGIRGDIIKTMHRAVSAADRQPDVAGFAPHGDEASEPVMVFSPNTRRACRVQAKALS